MIKTYLKIMLRNLVKHKTFSIINISGLAIGMASFLLIFLYVQFELSYDHFHKNADSIYRIRNDRIYQDIQDKSAGSPPGLGPALKKEFPEVLEYARLYNISYGGGNNTVSYTPVNRPVENGANPELSPGKPVTFNQEGVFFADASFLKIFSFPTVSGSLGTALEAPNTAIISRSSSRKYFGDASPMGKTITVSNYLGTHSYRITGVVEVPSNSHVKFEFLLSYKTLIGSRPMAENYVTGWNAFNTYVLLSPTADPRSLESKLPGLIDKHGSHGRDYKRVYLLQPLKDIHLYSHLRWEVDANGNINTVYFLILIGVVIIVIAWVNYINLSTARSMTRAKEVGIRKVLGSRRSQLVKQFIFESALLNIPAMIIAVILVESVLPSFKLLTGKPLASMLSSWQSAWIWVTVIFLTGAFVSGIYPAFILSSYKPESVLKGNFSRSVKGLGLRKALVVFQFAISIVLIAVTAAVFRQLVFMGSRDLGMDIQQTLVVKAPMGSGIDAGDKSRFIRELNRYPLFKGITISTTVPGREFSTAASGIRPLNSQPQDGKRCFFMDVDDNYFDFFGVLLLAGRNFSRGFGADKEAVVLNEEAVKIFGFEKPERALNQKILLGGLGNRIREVIGVIKNYHHKSLKDSLEPVIFSFTEDGNYFSIRLGDRDIHRGISIVRNQWREAFPGHPFEFFFLDEAFDSQYKSERQLGKIFGLFAVLAIFLSCLGLFGLVSFSLRRRTKEIGIRKVVGGSVPGIVLLLSKEFTLWIVFANIAAWPAAYFFIGNWLQNFAYRVDVGIGLFILSGMTALVIALLTVSIQTIRAASANPVEALNYE